MDFIFYILAVLAKWCISPDDFTVIVHYVDDIYIPTISKNVIWSITHSTPKNWNQIETVEV